MEVVKTNPEVVIPTSVDNFIVRGITIHPSTQVCTIEVVQGMRPKVFTADLTTAWSQVSAANKTIIKTFLKKLVEITLVVNTQNITGEALP